MAGSARSPLLYKCCFSTVRRAICGCSHQGGSRDSGVYSSDGSGSESQPSSQQTSRGSDVFWMDLCALDKLKVDLRAAGLPLGDEGVADVCI